MKIVGIDHVQLAMPAGQEQAAREFYAGLLRIPERPKPANLAVRGGAWFEDGPVKLHLGVESEFSPARKAHPGLLVADLPALIDWLREAGVAIIPDDTLPGQHRCFVHDPFGNRLELLAAPVASTSLGIVK